MKAKPTTQGEPPEIEMQPDAWARFEKAVTKLAGRKPTPRRDVGKARA